MKYVFTLLIGLTSLVTTSTGQEMSTTIFNGTDLDGWMVPDSNVFWSAKDGILSAQSDPAQKGSILWTSKAYRDFILDLEFKMGDGIVDSGVFIRETKFQIQIGESGSLKRDMTASPYIPGKGYPVEASNIARLLKPNDWNTMRIQAEGKKATVWLNDEEVMTYTTEEVIEEGPIGLQLHPKRDMNIDFRNLTVIDN